MSTAEAAERLARACTARGIACTVNGDSAGYYVFAPLGISGDFTLCIARMGRGHDWQVTEHGEQVLAGSWDTAGLSGIAARFAEKLIEGLGEHITR
jgi:hypothetical protein